MKKLAFYTLCLMTFALLGARMDAAAQGKQAQPASQKAGDSTAKSTDTSAAASTDTAAAADETAAAVNEGEDSIHYVFKQKFIEGDVVWMAPVLLCLIFGLGVIIERVIYLNLATTNTSKLLNKVEDALK
ncbi:MAG: MotA/TolQ/ExbB proton channel family protein, partial [Bacteroidota bacterium]